MHSHNDVLMIHTYGSGDGSAADRTLRELLPACDARDEVTAVDKDTIRRGVETDLAVVLRCFRLVHDLRRLPELNDLVDQLGLLQKRRVVHVVDIQYHLHQQKNNS